MIENGCPLCHFSEGQCVEEDAELGYQTWKCLFCGRFTLWPPFTNPETLRKSQHVLRGLSVERKLRNEGALVVRVSNIEALLEQGPSNPVEQADRFLLNLAIKSSEPGIMTALSSRYHGGLAFTAAVDAFTAMLAFLKAEGFIEYYGERSHQLNDFGFRLTLAGWRRVAELKKSGRESSSAFVAMPFHLDFNNLWEKAIHPGLMKAGWRAIRSDREHHNDRIDDWIMNQIRASRFLVVDTTGNNPGACFEAGYALGLHKPVIWTVCDDFMNRRDGSKGLHFDIRQHNHLSWTPGAEETLAAAITERVINTVGRGSL